MKTIEKEDLMIGNYFMACYTHVEDPLRVAQKIMSDNFLNVLNDPEIIEKRGNEVIKSRLHSFQAIPLEEIWLIAFGFEHKRKNGIKYYEENQIAVVETRSRGFMVYLNNELIGTCESVHELQQIYFSVRKAKLTIQNETSLN